MPKLIFVLIWLEKGPNKSKMMGYKFSDPSFPLWGLHLGAILTVLKPNREITWYQLYFSTFCADTSINLSSIYSVKHVIIFFFQKIFYFHFIGANLTKKCL